MPDEITTQQVTSAVALRPDGVDCGILCETLGDGRGHGDRYVAALMAVRHAIAAGVIRETGAGRIYPVHAD